MVDFWRWDWDGWRWGSDDEWAGYGEFFSPASTRFLTVFFSSASSLSSCLSSTHRLLLRSRLLRDCLRRLLHCLLFFTFAIIFIASNSPPALEPDSWSHLSRLLLLLCRHPLHHKDQLTPQGYLAPRTPLPHHNPSPYPPKSR